MARAKRWRPLEKGDIVDVIAPGFKTSQEELDAAVAGLRDMGFEPRVPKNLYGRHYLMSNSDEHRFAHLKEALFAKDSTAIWCVRGGYGSIRLLPYLKKIRKQPSESKLFIGLSDVTSLHLFFNQHWGWPTVHGPLLERLQQKKVRHGKQLNQLLQGGIQEVEFKGLKPMNSAAKKRAAVYGEVVGGNLTVVQSTLATPWQIQTHGKILFFEEVGERGYRIDRILVQMQQAGLIKKAKAIVFGQFTGGSEKTGQALWRQVKRDFAQDLNIPVFRGLPSGHGKIQKPVPFGIRARLTGGEKGTLICPTGAKI